MPEDLKLSQIGSSQLPPPFRGLHSPGVRKHCQIIFACYSGNRLLVYLQCCLVVTGVKIIAQGMCLVPSTLTHTFSPVMKRKCYATAAAAAAAATTQIWVKSHLYLGFVCTSSTCLFPGIQRRKFCQSLPQNKDNNKEKQRDKQIHKEINKLINK